ncbi:PIKK family atypical protein kinase [Tritrichomonas foetus]|uniref:non-specific serine/threonine protein kinase n=1 Tax=Tritrichomonas foetus TaxID=1144522 RepID=A0A1J4KDW8_9EUKA|nr:PIKK family atypical protein kinase [Tritrichomonas foetus]|eukprot:OHT09395.1 PIKK family atypical protein kinase [Tritrichomonas foetus]
MKTNDSNHKSVLLFSSSLNSITNYDSFEFQVCILNFKSYILNEFSLRREQNNITTFFSEIFSEISRASSSLTFITLLYVTIDINLGDKVQKSIEIARWLENIPLNSGGLFWDYFEKIIIYLNRTLRKSFDQILNRFRERTRLLSESTQADDGRSPDDPEQLFNLLSILCKHFPETMVPYQRILITNVFTPSLIVADSKKIPAIIDAIKSLFTYLPRDEEYFKLFCKKLSVYLSSKDHLMISNACLASQVLLDVNPKCTNYFRITLLPVPFLTSRDILQKLAAFSALPICFKCSSNLFTDDVNQQILKQYEVLVRKKSQNRDEALIGLANYLFARQGTFNQSDLKRIKKCHKSVEELVDTESAGYCLCALMASMPDQTYQKSEYFVKVSEPIFSLPLSSLLTDGILKYSAFAISNAEYCVKRVLSMANTILLSFNSTTTQVMTAFQCIQHMQIESKYLTLPLIMQFSIYMNHDDIQVRRIASDIVLKYQRAKPSIDVVQRVLSVISTENHAEHRQHLMESLYKQPSDETILPLLQSLLHDLSSQIRRETLRYMAVLTHIPAASELLHDFLSEKINDIEHNTISKEHVECFFIVSDTAYKNQKEIFAQHTKNLLAPFSRFLITHILNSSTSSLPTQTIRLLAQIIPLAPNCVDISKLCIIISNCLQMHSSENRLEAARDLIQSALDYTNLKYTIYSSHSDLIIKLFALSNVSNSNENGMKIIKLLGSIGAIDPQTIKDLHKSDDLENEKATTTSPNKYVLNFTPLQASEALTVASVGVSLMNILDILSEESLSSLHAIAFTILPKILGKHRTSISGSMEAEFLQRITKLLTTASDSTILVIINYMVALISVLQERFAPLVPHVINLITKYWSKLDQALLMRVGTWMMQYNRGVCNSYLPRLASVYVSEFSTADEKKVSSILVEIVSFGGGVSTVDHIIFPPILKWIQSHANDNINNLLTHLKQIVVQAESLKFASQILKVMIQVGQINKQVASQALEVVMAVAVQIGQQFLLFVPHVTSVFNIDDVKFMRQLILRLELNQPLTSNITEGYQFRRESSLSQAPISGNPGKIDDCSCVPFQMPPNDADDGQWITWCNELFSSLIRKSAARAISACEPLVSKHYLIRDALYPLAFAIFYFPPGVKEGLIMPNKDIKNILISFFRAESVPRQIIRPFLNVIELFELLQIKPPNKITEKMIIDRAEKAERIPQALRVSEKLFEQGDDKQTERLIVYNQQLGLPLAANGVLRIAAGRGFSTTKGVLAERLGLWEDALKSYNSEINEDTSNNLIKIGRLRCLAALSQYNELKRVAIESGSKTFEAKANWHLFKDDEFISTVKSIDANNDEESKYYYALYKTLIGKLDEAEILLKEIRESMILKIFPTISEDYERVYNDFARVSLCTEIEEAIQYMRLRGQYEGAVLDDNNRQSTATAMQRIVNVWKLRYKELPENPVILHETLRIRSLVMNVKELKYEWFHFIDVATKCNRVELARLTIDFLREKGLAEDNDLKMAQARLMWSLGDDAIKYLRENVPVTHPGVQITIGKWLMEQDKFIESRKHISKSVLYMPDDYKLWSQVNYKLFEETKEVKYLVDSFEASLNGLSVSTNDPLSFTLRILSNLFRRGCKEIYEKFQAKIKTIPVHVWIDVLPQIIARAHSKDQDLREIIVDLIYAVGAEQPHVVLYSLMVPLKSDQSVRQHIAATIFSKLSILFPTIVDQMKTLADELIRTAVTWWETWNTSLEEASHAYITRNDPDEMVSLLSPLHKLTNKPPETFYEVMFARSFGQQLEEASEWINRYKETHTPECLYQAWARYITVFHQVKPFINDLKSIPLADASPILASMHSTELVVPGTYAYNEPLIYLTEIAPVMTVMKSKQRPRRMAMRGSDGMTYTFLLKAHEDTRLDERVMQFFTLINTLISHSAIPMKDRLNIATYKVIPLTGEVGLIGWVPSCNTLYEIVRDHRKKLNIPLEVEFMTTMKIAPNYETLPLIDKEKAFIRGLKAEFPSSVKLYKRDERETLESDGNDLKHLLLALSDDSNHWLERRIEFSTSLAMTSMSGYILGLGDRHLSNIMIKKRSAKLVHIDFGDCFEVAMHRDKYPERVPFRLTRILRNALELSSTEGTFRTCCENVIDLFRNNRHQIIGLLEVFIYDPLLQWIDSPSTDQVNKVDEPVESSSAAGIIKRIKNKLKGADFDEGTILNVNDQVDRLIHEATDTKNLCQMFRGWFPWW